MKDTPLLRQGEAPRSPGYDLGGSSDERGPEGEDPAKAGSWGERERTGLPGLTMSSRAPGEG
jgi:hypothetical protein